MLHPERDEVRIGGISPAEAITRWPGALACVPQDVAMANGTIREGVALGLAASAIDSCWTALAVKSLLFHVQTELYDERKLVNPP